MSVSKNLNRRAHVILPIDVVADIDKLVGKRGRSAFLTELAQREIKLRHKREVLRETAGAWKSEDHPELAQGAAAWVRQIRALDNERSFRYIRSMPSTSNVTRSLRTSATDRDKLIWLRHDSDWKYISSV
jgi:hypothetical protein